MLRKYIAAVMAVSLSCIILLTGCSKGNSLRVVGDDKYEDEKTGVVYYSAPGSYEPINMSDEKYGHIGDVTLYKIEGADPEKWLCESSGTVFYAEDVVLPDIDEMSIDEARILLEDVTLATVNEANILKSIVETYADGENIPRPFTTENMLEVNWRIKFVDKDLGLYYTLAYIELTEDYVVNNDDGTQTNYGKKFLFDRFQNKCVAAGDVLEAYVSEYKSLNEAK